MNKKYWPIQPTFISDCKNKGCKGLYTDDCENSELRIPNIHGIFKADELRGFLADASDDNCINNPLSLFQVVPDNFEGEKSSRIIKEITPRDEYINAILGGRRIFRIDPGKLYSNFHCCDLFRQCNNGKNEALCYESDCRIALLYHPKVETINIETDFKLYYQTLQIIVDEYNKYKGFDSGDLSLRIEKYCLTSDSREYMYISYKCQYSKLEEFFFPVVYAGRVVAVLMQGQRFSEGMTREDVFKEYIDNSPQGKKLSRSIANLGRKYFKEAPMSEKRLKAITCRIIRLEEKICEEINAAAQAYVNNRFSDWQLRFRNKIKELDSGADNVLAIYNHDLSQILKEIFEEFHNEGFIRIYTIQQSNEVDDVQNGCIFELIGDSSCAQSPLYKTLCFSSFPLKKEAIEKEELVGYMKTLPTGFNKDKDIFRMEVPLTSQKAFILWKHYDQVCCGEQKKHNEYYCDRLKSFYPTLLEPFFILEGAKFEKKLEMSMRISVHESAQVIPSVIASINSPESLKILEEGGDYNGNPTITKPMHTILDVSNRLLLLEGLFRRSTLIFKKDPPKYQWCDLHRIIYSAKSLFNNTVYRNNRQSLQIVSENKFSKYRLYTDYALLSHVLFNLLDNAVKYGRKGSNIYIKVVLEFDPLIKNLFDREDVTQIRISIVSFGDEIIDRESIFKLYYRAASNEIEGMGIGLFLVKKICSSLHYPIECMKSVKLSDVNMPLHYCYREQNNVDDVEISEKSKRIIKKKLPQDVSRLVVNLESKNEWEVTEMEVEELLDKAIFQNEFQISIPIIMNKNLNIH